MKFTKFVFFMVLIATGITPLYGMNISKSLTERLENKNLSEQDILNILQENEDYEQLIIKEQKYYMKWLDARAMYIRLGLAIPDHLTISAGDYSVSCLNAELFSRAIRNEHTLLINFLVGKNINLSRFAAESLLIDSMKNNVLQRYVVGSEQEKDQKILVEFLIRKEIDVDRVLEAAVLAGYPTVVELSVKNGANINGVDNNFRPLNAAVFLHVDNVVDRSQTIKVLLDAGADTKLLNKNGESVEGMIKEKSLATQQTDWAQSILSKNSLPESHAGGDTDNNPTVPKPHVGGNPDNNPLPNPHVGGNPDNNPTPSIFNVIKQNKGFVFVGVAIGAGVIIWGCKKLYAKYQEYTKQQEQEQKEEVDEDEQGAQEAVN